MRFIVFCIILQGWEASTERPRYEAKIERSDSYMINWINFDSKAVLSSQIVSEMQYKGIIVIS